MYKVIDFVSSLVIAFILLRCCVTVDTWEFWVILLLVSLVDVVSFIDGLKERGKNDRVQR